MVVVELLLLLFLQMIRVDVCVCMCCRRVPFTVTAAVARRLLLLLLLWKNEECLLNFGYIHTYIRQKKEENKITQMFSIDIFIYVCVFTVHMDVSVA